ncbi:hypothetical protein ACIA6C_09200 [Streptomyces sp. NPDC051578]|uniref:hypothetical protein n=1 Tax=Streptomyces sp. NPDC051578 TaxID=3365662 RepID=UPI0037A71EF0
MRHTRRFTVVGNHLAQHAEMSLVAIGLALHIQSLPAGSRIGIKDLAARFPESEHRIARALRELEVYLARTRVRLPGGQVVTRTVSYNRPGCGGGGRPRPTSRAPSRGHPDPRGPGHRGHARPPRPGPRAARRPRPGRRTAGPDPGPAPAGHRPTPPPAGDLRQLLAA